MANGITLFFKDEKGNKRKTFLKHDPYFYLLLNESITDYRKAARLQQAVRDIDSRIVDIQYVLST